MNITATCCSCGAHWWYREDWTLERVRADRCTFCGGILSIDAPESEESERNATARRLVLSALED